jgi:hypothetical protein
MCKNSTHVSGKVSSRIFWSLLKLLQLSSERHEKLAAKSRKLLCSKHGHLASYIFSQKQLTKVHRLHELVFLRLKEPVATQNIFVSF